MFAILAVGLLLSPVSSAFGKPATIEIGALYSSRTNNYPVRTHGTVIDVFADEVDFHFAFLLIKDAEFILPVAVPNTPLADLKSLINAEIALTGEYSSTLGAGGDRRYSGPFIGVKSKDDITLLKSPPTNPYNVPELEATLIADPHTIAKLGRRKITGRVLAVWDGQHALLRLPDGRIVKTSFAEGQPLPTYRQSICAVGHATTDQFRINLRRATWKPASVAVSADEQIIRLSPRSFLTRNGLKEVNVKFYGKTLCLEGIVRSVPGLGEPAGRMFVECDGIPIAVDGGANTCIFSATKIGSIVSVTGTCLIDAPDWQPFDIFPRLKDCTIILRTPQDLRLLAAPPWWTPWRVALITLILSLALIAIIIWNAALKRLITKRTQQLLREELAAVKAELRTNERTHLAIELHDALSQSLTGIALQTKTAARIAQQDLPAALHCLDLVQKSLSSCREELRSCLWDLRNDASGRDSIDEAVRITLQPLTGETQVCVRFNMPRSRFSESTVSTILRIVRELVVNAIRHGKAKKIKVVGCLDGESVKLSVTDDGQGFDPTAAPGMNDGHFGLQGIQERLDKLHGKMTIESSPKKGTRVFVEFPLQHIEVNDKENR